MAFDGRRLAGRYALFPLDDGAWNIRKLDATPAPADDVGAGPAADAGHPGELPPRRRTTAGATSSSGTASAPSPPVHGGVLALTSRKGTDITVRVSEVAGCPEALAGHDAVVDGEIVAMDERGRPDFGALQNRMHRTGPRCRGWPPSKPVTYLVFDLLSWDGEDLLDGPTPSGGSGWTPWASPGTAGWPRRGSAAAGPACWPPARRTGSRASSPSG